MKFLDHDLLDSLERPEFAELRKVLRRRAYAPGALIFGPCEAENLVFVVASGRVRVYLSYEEKEFTLAVLGRGDIYSNHSGTFIEALDEAELLVTDVRTVRARMLGIPEVTLTMIRVLGNLLRNTFSIIDGLVFHDAGRRLAAFLAGEARKSGVAEGGGVLLHLDLPVEQLACLVGATRQTVSALLGDMARQGLLEKRARGLYFIPDLDALERTASA
ncbi:Crp/Fnr family transcriptional regulator [Desulfocurvus vexinensis]|uniref:Crp/Fnr family transcriptional regulator n=1 Tax=Desulfocurvus vexinensis TaxID=399548 RepID=UPI00048E3A17|nr:Crp/Fnr family transcriptional regulator [Desulfocurvus vexinensis]